MNQQVKIGRLRTWSGFVVAVAVAGVAGAVFPPPSFIQGEVSLWKLWSNSIALTGLYTCIGYVVGSSIAPKRLLPFAVVFPILGGVLVVWTMRQLLPDYVGVNDPTFLLSTATAIAAGVIGVLIGDRLSLHFVNDSPPDS